MYYRLTTPMKEFSIRVPRDVKPIDLRIVLDLVARRKIDLDGIIGAVRSPESAAQTYTELADPKTSLITVAFKGSDDCLTSPTHLCHKNTNGSNWFKRARSTSSCCVK